MPALSRRASQRMRHLGMRYGRVTCVRFVQRSIHLAEAHLGRIYNGLTHRALEAPSLQFTLVKWRLGVKRTAESEVSRAA